MIKTVWVQAHAVHGHDHIVDGHRLASETERALQDLDATGYSIVSIVPVVSGRYDYKKYDGRVKKELFTSSPTTAPDTCASWGYSMTDGVMVVARRV